MKNTHTSLELSKKLYEAGFKWEANYSWRYVGFGAMLYSIINKSKKWNNALSFRWEFQPTQKDSYREQMPAYDILNDLCVKYWKELFGEELHCYDCWEKVKPPLWNWNIQIWTWTCECSRQFEENEEAFEYHGKMVFFALQMWKKREAEDYLWENTLLNKSK